LLITHSLILSLSLFLLLQTTIAKLPVIIDTDIGGDIDDSWALALAAKDPTLDIKLVISATKTPLAKAKIIAKYLTIVHRDDIPIGVGVPQSGDPGPLAGWSADFDLNNYTGGVSQDGVGEAIKIIDASPDPIVFLEIAPVPNVQELLKRRPDLASKLIVVAMSGSIDLCYGGQKKPCSEYNVAEDVPASQVFYAAKYAQQMVTTPIDTGYYAIISGDLYQGLLKANDIFCTTLIECYTYWAAHGGHGAPLEHSTTLWDAVASYLVWGNRAWINFKSYDLIVNDKGETVTSSSGQMVNVSISWNDLDSWKADIVDKLVGPI